MNIIKGTGSNKDTQADAADIGFIPRHVHNDDEQYQGHRQQHDLASCLKPVGKSTQVIAPEDAVLRCLSTTTQARNWLSTEHFAKLAQTTRAVRLQVGGGSVLVHEALSGFVHVIDTGSDN